MKKKNYIHIFHSIVVLKWKDAYRNITFVLYILIYNGCVNSNTRKHYFSHWFSEHIIHIDFKDRQRRLKENDKCDNQSNGKNLRVNMTLYILYSYICVCIYVHVINIQKKNAHKLPGNRTYNVRILVRNENIDKFSKRKNMIYLWGVIYSFLLFRFFKVTKKKPTRAIGIISCTWLSIWTRLILSADNCITNIIWMIVINSKQTNVLYKLKRLH